jgi:hypothetical protein
VGRLQGGLSIAIRLQFIREAIHIALNTWRNIEPSAADNETLRLKPDLKLLFASTHP